MARILTGDRRLDLKLRMLGERTAKRVAANGIRAGMRVIAKAIKSEIPPSMKSAKQAIGSRFKRLTKKGDVVAKVGGGVGKKGKSPGPRGSRPGVGISKANIHWVLMGTGQRTQKTTGRSTGRMPAIGAVPRGFEKSKATAGLKVEQTILKGIAREAAKR